MNRKVGGSMKSTADLAHGWIADMFDCRTCGFLDDCTVGLPSCCAAGFSGCWALGFPGCGVLGRLDCWALGIVGRRIDIMHQGSSKRRRQLLSCHPIYATLSCLHDQCSNMGSECGESTVLKASPPQYCSSPECSESECCDSRDQCSNMGSECSASTVLKASPPQYCSSPECSESECCDSRENSGILTLASVP